MSGKRIVTFTLLVGMMLSVCMFTSFAQEFYYSENFDEIVTNDAFSNGKVVGEQARVVEYKEGQDKGLFFISKDSDASATFTLAGSPEELVVTADVLLSGDRPSGKIVLNDTANKAFNALTIGADGSVFTNDGRKVGSIGMNQWTDITLVFKFNESRYSAVSYTHLIYSGRRTWNVI